MICKKYNKCKSKGCSKTAYFNLPGAKVAKLCNLCKSPKMTIIYNKCFYVGCDQNAILNIKGEKSKYCRLHKTNNISKPKSKICFIKDCNKTAIFNIKGQPRKYCLNHKTTDMIDLSHSKCLYENCKVVPYFNYPFAPENKGIYCAAHKLPDMINIIKLRKEITKSKNKSNTYLSTYNHKRIKLDISTETDFFDCSAASEFIDFFGPPK
jgi:hypothetical protein